MFFKMCSWFIARNIQINYELSIINWGKGLPGVKKQGLYFRVRPLFYLYV